MARDLRAELLQAEAVHFAKVRGTPLPDVGGSSQGAIEGGSKTKRMIEGGEEEVEDIEAKRRRVLEETRDIDADSEEGDDDSSEDDSDDDEDETAELQRELEKIKRERAEKREQEVRDTYRGLTFAKSTIQIMFSMALTNTTGTREGGRRRGCSG